MSSPTRTGTVALIVSYTNQKPNLLGSLSDDREIETFHMAREAGSTDPMDAVVKLREQQKREDEEFGDYIEELLTKPGVRTEIQDHGVQWLKSKMKMERFHKTEKEATAVIAEYAFKVFEKAPEKTEFILAGPSAQVQIRIFVMQSESSVLPGDSSAA